MFSAERKQSLGDWSSVGCAAHRAVADVRGCRSLHGVAVATRDRNANSKTKRYRAKSRSRYLGALSAVRGFAPPLVPSVFALAGWRRGVEYPSETLYQNEKRRRPHCTTSLPSADLARTGDPRLPFDEEESAHGLHLTGGERQLRAAADPPRPQRLRRADGRRRPHGSGGVQIALRRRALQLAEINSKKRTKAKTAAEAEAKPKPRPRPKPPRGGKRAGRPKKGDQQKHQGARGDHPARRKRTPPARLQERRRPHSPHF